MYFPFADNELKALIRLLEDPDSKVYERVSRKLVSYGKTVIPHLETEWELRAQNAIQLRIVEIIDQIEFDICLNALTSWKTKSSNDLLEGALAASLFKYPNQVAGDVQQLLEQLHKDVWLELNENLTSLEKIRVVNHIVYSVYQLKPHPQHHNSDNGWFLNQVLEEYKASPASAVLLYKILADRLNLPIVAVRLPNQTLLGYKDVFNTTNNEILFYINPIANGTVFSSKQLNQYAKAMGLLISESELTVMDNKGFLKYWFSDLRNVYQKVGEYQKMKKVDKLINIL